MKAWLGSAGIVAAILLLCMAVVPVSAHELSSNNGISAELHIPPLDEPIATQLTRLQFTLENPPATFSMQECDCRVEAAGPGNAVLTASVQLDASQPHRLLSQITFPKAGNYTLTLTGFTTSAGRGSFHISYPVHVEPAPVTVSQRNRTVGIVLILVCALAAVIVLWQYYRPKQKPRRPS